MNVLPHSNHAERAILAVPLLDESRWAEVADLNPRLFYRERHRLIWSAMLRVKDAGRALDVTTLRSELEVHGHLDEVGGPAYLAQILEGQARSANIEHYTGIVENHAARRDYLAGANRLIEAISSHAPDDKLTEIVASLREQLEPTVTSATWVPSTLEGVANPSAGEVEYLVDGLLPRGEVVLIGAGWKVGKTLISYRLILDTCTGSPALGHFAVGEPAPVALFQLEMPASEDDRRFRRIAIGRDMDPGQVPELVESGKLTVYNRPGMNLTKPEDVARFHQAVLDSGAQLVVIDSVLAAFAGADLNNNSEVRNLFSQAFLPLTSLAVTILLLHHQRKPPSGGRGKDDAKSALLGAQAWGAAAGRVYALERIADNDDDPREHPDRDHEFHARLSLSGSWTPEAESDLVIHIYDQDDGTVVTVLGEDQQLAAGGITKQQRAALALATMVRETQRISRRIALQRLKSEHDIPERTAKRGLNLARFKKWVTTTPSSSPRGVDLVPGPGLWSVE